MNDHTRQHYIQRKQCLIDAICRYLNGDNSVTKHRTIQDIARELQVLISTEMEIEVAKAVPSIVLWAFSEDKPPIK